MLGESDDTAQRDTRDLIERVFPKQLGNADCRRLSEPSVVRNAIDHRPANQR